MSDLDRDSSTKNNEISEGAVTRREVFGKTLAAATAVSVGSTLEAAPPDDAARADSVYRIHPAIGVMRVGNADRSTYFIGPEVPGYGPLGSAPGTTAPPYKVEGKVKPQAARFRVFEYRWTGTGANRVLAPYREVNLDTPGVSGVKWKVHLANKKASFHRFQGPAGERGPSGPYRNAAVADRKSLELDFGPRTINGRSQAPQEFRPTTAGAYPAAYPLNYQNKPVIDYLGELRTDSQGRLIVIGGQGRAVCQPAVPTQLASYANNDGWFDDIADGPVTASVTIQGAGGPIDVPVDAAGSAWVLCAPPDFAPRVRAAVTLYDLLYDLSIRTNIPLPSNNALYNAGGELARIRALKQDYIAGADYEFPNTVPDFNQDIYPILRMAYEFYWVTALVTRKHANLMDPILGDPGPAALKERQSVFAYMRPPLGINAPTGNRTMPRLLGDNPYPGQEPDAIRRLPLTHLQFALLRRWADGNFVAATPGVPPNAPPLPPPSITPHGLDRAALENCSGGAFYPGIEVGWQIRNPQLFIEPFRLNPQATSPYLNENGLPEGGLIGPGHFSRQMALPWHADFNDCANEGDYGWWPSQRPDDAFPKYNAPFRLDWARPDTRYPNGSQKSTHEDMLANWWKYAFVVQQAEQIVETERNTPIP